MLIYQVIDYLKYVVCFWFKVPYKIKDVELDYDNYNQVPESPIGRDEEPHLYMVPKKYRKVRFTKLYRTSEFFSSVSVSLKKMF